MNANNNTNSKRVPGLLVSAMVFVFSVIFILLGFSLIWCMRTWQHLNMDELVYELSAPLEGTGSDMIIKYVLNCVVPTAFIVVAIAVIRFIQVRKNAAKTETDATGKKSISGKVIKIGFPVLSLVFMLICLAIFWVRLDVSDYLAEMKKESTFIQDNYVDAGSVKLTFPEKKRNLIYIFLESIETTYTGIEDGGGFKKGCIPELTQLSKENENFSVDGKLNGGVVLPGTSWTMGGMFAQTSGLPLKIEIGDNMMDTQENFFPGITCLGDILAAQGYNQVLEIGSAAKFGGRGLYFEQHGNYTFHDYYYALSDHRIPENYHVFWGYEDEKLFNIAKEDLTELASKDAPFNYTILTVDSHFEDGYVCRLCGNEFGTDQYANVMACSSRQVTEFVEWIKQQDFYENTTIVISGDHTTMDADFCNNVDHDYLRKTYTAIINPATEKTRKDENIFYSTLDMFPTTLAAMGVTIEGDQLGLGVNLFSDKQTILEQYGLDTVRNELKKGSAFMNNLSGITITDEILSSEGMQPRATIELIECDSEAKTFTVEVRDILNMDDNPKVYATLYNKDGSEMETCKLDLNPDRNYTGVLHYKGLKKGKGKIVITATDKSGTYTLGKLKGYLRYQAHKDIVKYINRIKDQENIAILVGMREEAIENTQDVVFDALKDLGITLDLKGHKGQSFYAVIEGDNVREEMSKDAVSCEGTFIGDEREYSIKSAAEKAGNYCVITVKGKEYKTEKRGIYFVIYDTKKHTVVDKVLFNTSPRIANHPVCTVNVDITGKTAAFTLSDVVNAGETHRDFARMEIWDAKHPKKVIKLDLIYNYDDETFTGETKLSSINTSDCYFKVYIQDGKTLTDRFSSQWHGNLEELKDYRYIRY